MSLVVVDTNVGVAANGRETHVAANCIAECTRHLRATMKSETLVIDDGYRIVREYGRRLHQSGQPGPGDAFLKHVLTNLTNPSRCRQVAITPRGDDAEDYDEFPADPALASFDPSDRKFVAASMACRPERAPICIASDRGWRKHSEALGKHGAQVVFLCPEERGG